MIFSDAGLPGAWVIDLEKKSDERGFFARSWCQKEFESRGLSGHFVQCNISNNRRAGTLRGMHYQAVPHAESKLIRCSRGGVYMVFLDLRKDSPTMRKWASYELTQDNYRSLFVPEGCAVGFQTLADNTEVLYQMSEFFASDFARGVRYNDPAFGIEWPLPISAIAKRDEEWPDYYE
jgi:dTDP-4-dehydrorhamnose 3,5-epimerase